MNHPAAVKSVGNPRDLETPAQAVASAVEGLHAALRSNETTQVRCAARNLVTSLADSSSGCIGFKAKICSALSQLNPSLPSVLASFHQGRALFFCSIRELINELGAKTKDEARHPFSPTAGVSAEMQTSAVNGVFHHLATHESGRQTRLVRLTALDVLNNPTMNPITSMLLVVGEAKDPEIRAQAIRLLLNHLAYPLSQGAKVEIQAIHASAGSLLGVLCKGVDTSCGKPVWVKHIPELIKRWQLACSAAHVESGVNMHDLARCSVSNRGPLQDWEIRCATSPSDPFTFAFFQATLRGVVGR